MRLGQPLQHVILGALSLPLRQAHAEAQGPQGAISAELQRKWGEDVVPPD